MPARYTDFSPSNAFARDFVIRRRLPAFPHLLLIFLSTLLVILALTLAVADKTVLGCILFAFVGLAGWYALIQIQRNRDLLLATEFQNAIFASALGLNNKFCIIIRRDGNIVYIDRSFQDMFPDFLKQPQRSIMALMEHGKVSSEDSEKIAAAVSSGTYDKVVFDIHAAKGESYRIIMSIEPILRPTGFILLRGREFIEKRSTEAAPAPSGNSLPNLLSRPTITLFSHVMESMNMGIYMAGPSGSIIYANPVLEQWLGFQEGEITSGNLFIKDIIYQKGKAEDAMLDQEGEILMQKKTGGMMKAFINQKIIRDADNKVVGITALVHNFIEPTQDGKKKIW